MALRQSRFHTFAGVDEAVRARVSPGDRLIEPADYGMVMA